LHANTARAAELLGYKATIGFEDGIRRYVDWFRGHYPDPASMLEDKLENWSMPPQTAGGGA
jgi:hypothetical protein